MPVHHLLSSGDDPALTQLMAGTGLVANFLERRGQTVICTVMDDDLSWVVEVARGLGLTVQRIEGAGASERYETIHQGSHPGWGRTR